MMANLPVVFPTLLRSFRRVRDSVVAFFSNRNRTSRQGGAVAPCNTTQLRSVSIGPQHRNSRVTDLHGSIDTQSEDKISKDPAPRLLGVTGSTEATIICEEDIARRAERKVVGDAVAQGTEPV